MLEDYLKKYLPKDKLEEGLNKLKKGMPVQYIVGNVDFYDVNLLVNKDVLIPRFETETLVEKTINYAKNLNTPLDILDIGTGSGAIAITLAKHLNSNVLATDISEKALEIAQKNAKRNNVKISFKQSNLFHHIKGKFDIIISNPPYIAKDEIIDPLVKNNEPPLALYADNNGLYFYQNILQNINPYLKEKSLIAFEIGMTQSKAIAEIAKTYLPNSIIKTEKDLAGKDRYIFIFNNISN